MNSRRRFIAIAPWVALGGTSLLAACSDSKAPPSSAPSAAPSPSPTPAPMPAPSPAPAETSAAPTAAGAMVSPTEPQAAALGYVAMSSQADQAKYPAHSKSQNCAGCALYTGAAGAAAGPCSIFGGRQVSAQGWCSAWAKKA